MWRTPKKTLKLTTVIWDIRSIAVFVNDLISNVYTKLVQVLSLRMNVQGLQVQIDSSCCEWGCASYKIILLMKWSCVKHLRSIDFV